MTWVPNALATRTEGMLGKEGHCMYGPRFYTAANPPPLKRCITFWLSALTFQRLLLLKEQQPCLEVLLQ